jgi:hypothetical protein
VASGLEFSTLGCWQVTARYRGSTFTIRIRVHADRVSTGAAGAPPSGQGGVQPALVRPYALAVAADGSVLIANEGTHQVLRRLTSGQLQVVAGTGIPGWAGDGGPAVDARLDTPRSIAVSSDGTIFVGDDGEHRVRAISLAGIITTVAGNGSTPHGQSVGDGGLAVDAPLYVNTVAAGPESSLYIGDPATVRRVSSNGTIRAIIGTSDGRVTLDGEPTALTPSALAVDTSGALYVADFSPKLIFRAALGNLTTVAPGTYVSPSGLASAPDGAC